MSRSKSCGDELLDDCLREAIDCALQARDEAGVNIAKTFILIRVWSGENIGYGEPTDTLTLMSPSPSIREIKKDFTLKNVGMVRSGDVMLKSISFSVFANEDEARLVTPEAYIEKFFSIDGVLYRPISVTRNFATWNMVIRPIIDDRTYQDSESSDIIA